MDPISFAFSALSMVDLAIKYGQKLYQKCLAYTNADWEIREATLCIQDHWIKIEYQLIALSTIWESLDDRLQAHHTSILQVLHDKLNKAIRVLDTLMGESAEESTWNTRLIMREKARHFKYAAYKKATLMEIIDDLQKWRRMFDPSWFLLARITVPMIDEQLTEKAAAESKAISTVKHLREARQANDKNETSSSIFLPTGPEEEGRVAVEYSSVCISHSAGGQRIIIDHFAVPEQADVDSTTKDVRDLARILSNIDPDVFGLLPCQGIAMRKAHNNKDGESSSSDTPQVTGFEFISTVPSEFGTAVPRSLRSVLLDRQNTYSLNDRFDIAVSLARSIVFLHSSGFVHKSISPEHIIIFERPSNNAKMVFLVGFERFRLAEGRTYMRGDNLWEKDLYRHPKRQGLFPEELYTMRHDIYSVGVCLLEIGLWTSFIHYAEDGTAKGLDTVLPVNAIIGGTKDKRRAAEHLKAMLVELTQSEMPKSMGKRYTEIATFCLRCLDKTDEGPFVNTSEFEDEDGLLVGVRYIEKVLFEMEKIAV